MSMILDALRRSREESRQAGSVPSLEAEHEVSALFKPGPPRWLIALIGVALLGLVTGIAGWLLSTDAPPATVVPAREAQGPTGMSPSATPAPPAPRGVVAATPDAQRVPTRAATPDPRVAALYADVETGAPSPAGEGAEASPAQRDQSPESPDVEDSTPAATGVPAQGAQPEVEETAIDFEAVLRRAQQEFGQPTLVPHPAPLIDSLSQQKKNAIPTVLYTVHDYAGNGEAAVVLNGRRLVAGDSSDGFRVVTILVDSVVLNYGGTEFRLRALNSWVNL